MIGHLTTLDLTVLVLYLVGATGWGAWLGRGQTSGGDYFLGGRDLPWGLVTLSIVATETSTLTFLSVPAVSYLGSLTFLQLTFGYCIGRLVVALLLLPAYFRGNLLTAYGLLEERFGVATRRTVSGIFMVARVLADSVRLFSTAIPLALITGWSYPVSIGVIGILTVVYTYAGGIRAVVWIDALQMGLYLLGAAVALVIAGQLVAGGWPEIFARAAEHDKLVLFDLTWTATRPYTLWAGLLGGAFLSMASHGTDQMFVQRLLTCRSLRAAQRALVVSGLIVVAQFALFLVVGLGLWSVFDGRSFERPDEIFATFIVTHLPTGIAGLLLAGVFAAAMSSLSSSLNSLSSVITCDFWAPLTGGRVEDRAALSVGRTATLVWAIVLIGGAILFIPLSRRTTAVELALAVASLVYGGMLGAFFLAALDRRATQGATLVGLIAGVGVATAVWMSSAGIAWPYLVPIGSAVTVGVGSSLSRVGRRPMR